MNVLITAETEQEAREVCTTDYFYPAEVIEVDPGQEEGRAWLCFDTEDSYITWSNQQ